MEGRRLMGVRGLKIEAEELAFFDSFLAAALTCQPHEQVFSLRSVEKKEPR